MAPPFDLFLKVLLFWALFCLRPLGLHPPGWAIPLDPDDVRDPLLSDEFTTRYPDVVLGPCKDPVGFEQCHGLLFQDILFCSHNYMITETKKESNKIKIFSFFFDFFFIFFILYLNELR